MEFGVGRTAVSPYITTCEEIQRRAKGGEDSSKEFWMNSQRSEGEEDPNKAIPIRSDESNLMLGL